MSRQLLFHVSAIVPVHNIHRIHTKTVVTEINETHPRYDVYSKLLQNANVNADNKDIQYVTVWVGPYSSGHCIKL